MRGHVAYMECLWPGLPQLWRRGSWLGLATALLFAVLLNAALASTLLWTEVITPGGRNVIWAATLVLWTTSISLSYWKIRKQHPDVTSAADRDLFPDALSEYLKGNWFQVEALCHELLRKDDRDADAHLMLATMFRHTGRLDEAEDRLKHLATLSTAAKWALEIADEEARGALARETALAKTNPPESAELRDAA